MTDTPYRRKNKDAFTKARQLVATWYAHRVDQRVQGYATVGSRPVMPSSQVVNPGGTAWRPTPNPKQQSNRYGEELEPYRTTASGTETRQPSKYGGGISSSFVTDQKGFFKLDRRLYFADRVMRHLNVVDIDAHSSLEMDAAGYTYADIGDEIGCSERQARSIVDQGLSIVVALQLLRHNIADWWPR